MTVRVNGFVVNKINVNNSEVYKINRITLNDSRDWEVQKEKVKLWNSRLFFSDDLSVCEFWVKEKLVQELINNSEIKFKIQKPKIKQKPKEKAEHINIHHSGYRLSVNSCVKEKQENKNNKQKESIDLFIKFIDRSRGEKYKLERFKQYVLDLFKREKEINKSKNLCIKIIYTNNINKEINFVDNNTGIVIRRVPVYF